MILYYILLFFARFHDDPRLGGTFFNAGFLMLSPVKGVGALALVAAIISRRPVDAAPRRRNALVVLFLLFPSLPILTAIVSSTSVPDEWMSHAISFVLMLLTTRLLVSTEERIHSTVRTLVVVYLFSILWILKQHFIQHQDRVVGLEMDPNYEALGLVTMIPVAVWLARHEQKMWLKRLALFSVPIFTYATLLTQSRGAALALVVLGIGVLLRSQHKAVLAIVLAAIFPLATMVLPAGFTSRIGNTKISGLPSNGDEESSRIHFELIRAALRMMSTNPVLGVRIGRFVEEAPNYNPDLVNVTEGKFIAHNTYLQVGAECGLPVLTIWLSLMFVGLTNLRYVENLAHGQSLGDLAVAIRFAVLAYGISAFFLTAVWVVPYWLMIFLSQNLKEIAIARYAELSPFPEEIGGAGTGYFPTPVSLVNG